MVEYINTSPSSVRGGGFLLEQITILDLIKNDCDVSVHSETIHDLSAYVFRLGTGQHHDGYTAIEVMELIDDTLVKNISFSNNQIRYDLLEVEDVTSVNDLNGVITGIRFVDDMILFDTFESSNALIYDSDLAVLSGALTSITYNENDCSIRYNTVGDIDE